MKGKCSSKLIMDLRFLFIVFFIFVLLTILAEYDNSVNIDGYSYRPLGPDIDQEYSKNVTALAGHTAILTCRLHNSRNGTISWVRHQDYHVLTVGRDTYTNDQRFQAVQNPHSDEWILQIMYPQEHDSGIYECQINTTPPIRHFTHLVVIQPNITIIGGPEMYIIRGSTINLTCIIEHSPEPSADVRWTHNNEKINYDSPRGGVSVITEKRDVVVSYLLIQRAKPYDWGIYSCSLSNAVTKEIIIHIVNGNPPAAMQHGRQLKLERPFIIFQLSLSAVFLRG